MSKNTENTDYRYVNDLRRFAFFQSKLVEQKKILDFIRYSSSFFNVSSCSC